MLVLNGSPRQAVPIDPPASLDARTPGELLSALNAAVDAPFDCNSEREHIARLPGARDAIVRKEFVAEAADRWRAGVMAQAVPLLARLAALRGTDAARDAQGALALSMSWRVSYITAEAVELFNAHQEVT